MAINKKVSTRSVEEKERFLKEGYAIVSLAQFVPNGKWTFHLEKGSDWSRMLGSK
ncbi:hypothetical protein [Anaerotruncus sp. G3(2012)]|uniref:hypothetical protein n=1 Tax=Anaerotruncus sp. G3(2012) TaxID=1235835 RepID=UPI0012DF69B3|nr:hypothetical protein [Anaerotruncus sp. G3(2012)]